MEKNNYEKLYKSKNLYPIGPLNIVRNNFILDCIKEKSQKAILDIGCGRGFLDIELAKRGHTVVGVDFSGNAVEFAKRLAKEERVGDKTRFIMNDFFKLELSEKFDMVICSEVIEHIEDDANAIKKLRGFMKPDGKLIITVPNSMKQWNKDDKLSGHFRRYSVNSMRKLLEHENFQIEKIFVWGFPLMRIYRFLYRQTYRNSEDENLPLGYMPKGGLLRLYTLLSAFIVRILDIDKLFNFTQKGIDLVVVARKS